MYALYLNLTSRKYENLLEKVQKKKIKIKKKKNKNKIKNRTKEDCLLLHVVQCLELKGKTVKMSFYFDSTLFFFSFSVVIVVVVVFSNIILTKKKYQVSKKKKKIFPTSIFKQKMFIDAQI